MNYLDDLKFLEFKQTRWGEEAWFRGVIIGATNYRYGKEDSQKKALAAFHAEARAHVASKSDTVELKTLCECTRLQDGVGGGMREWRVPLLGRAPVLMNEETPAESLTYKVREFRFKGDYCREGFRIFEERENP
jgi:hypothetical protein